ncbi:MAG: NAD-dependent epimerase/dehydratase family protein [Bacteroidales bacterium]|nr:NAD-dependent epimerase/dehydratase family protein [Bacteroidales bacterium]
MKQIYIITGANGHLGSTIIRYLSRGDCLVRGLLLPSENHEDSGNVKYYKGDITDLESMDAIFSGTGGSEVIVIHTAGLVSIEDKITLDLYDVNVNGTKNVISMCRKYRAKRMLYVSSVHVIAEGDGFSIDSVKGGYATTKAVASQAVLDAVSKGLDAVIVLPSGIIGPFDNGRNHLVQLVKRFMEKKLPVITTGGYDMVDVRDVAKGCIAAADRGRNGESYILSNQYITIPDLIELSGELSGTRVPCSIPLSYIKAFAPLFEWIGRITHTRPLFTRYSLSVLEEDIRFSHEKATRELGYHPMDIKDSLRDTIDYLLYGEAALIDL